MHNNEPRTLNRAHLLFIFVLFLLIPYTAAAAAPAAPTNLIATTLSPAQIRLDWTDNSSDEIYFIIEMLDDYGAYSQWDWTYANVTTKDLLGLNSGTTYTFRVVAFNNDGRSYSDPVTATTVSIPAPIIQTATATSTSEIEIIWTDSRTDVMQYWIDIIGGPNGYDMRQADPGATSLIVSYLYPNTEYTFKIRSLDFMWTFSPYSNEARSTTKSDTVATELQAVALSSKRIKLTWVDVSNNETQYLVEFTKGTGAYAVLDPLPADTITYTHTNLEAGASYTYRVRSYNGIYYGPYSNEVTLATPGCEAEGAYMK